MAAKNRSGRSFLVKIQSTSRKKWAVIQAEQNTVEKDASLILYKYPVTDLVHSNHRLGYVQVESKVFGYSVGSMSDWCPVLPANCESFSWCGGSNSLLGCSTCSLKGTAHLHGNVKGMCGLVSIVILKACLFWQAAGNECSFTVCEQERERAERRREHIIYLTPTNLHVSVC